MNPEFWSIVCSFRRVRRVVLTFLMVFLVLQHLAFALVVPSGESFSISTINLFIYIPFIGSLLYIRYRCTHFRNVPE